MAWWNRKQPVRQIEVKSAMGSELRQFLIYGATRGAETPRAALSLFEESTAVFIPVNRIAEAVANLTPTLEVDGKKISSHPLLDFINNPGPNVSYELFIKSMAIYYLVTGETFLMTLGNLNSPPKEMYAINPGNVSHYLNEGMIKSLTVDGDFLPSSYSWDDKLGLYISRERFKTLHHIRDFSIKDNAMGRARSRLIPASNAARQQVLGVRHNLSVLERGGRLSLIFHFENDIDADDVENIKNRLQSQFGGADNAGSIAVTSGGKLNIERAGLTAQDMDWANAQTVANQTILMIYNLPLPMFSLDASTFNNMSTAMEMFYDDAVIPVSKVLFRGLENALFDRFKIQGNAILTFDPDKITALITRRNNEVKLRKEIGIETDNELRGILGREPYDGGDIMYKPSSEIPIGTDVLTTDDDVTIMEADEDGED